MGDRIGNCRHAIEEITEFSEIVKVSSIYETEAVGNEDQPDFINCAVKIKTELSPHDLLEHLNSIELSLGRVRTEKWGPRKIDLDIIFYGWQVINDDVLVIPHPRTHLRRFVLEPICEIAPDCIHPVLNLSIDDLLQECVDDKQVVKLDNEFTILQQ